jgi:hypothetical protein
MRAEIKRQKTEFRSQNCGLMPLLLDSFFKPDLQAHDVRITSGSEILTPEFCFLYFPGSRRHSAGN